MSKTRIKREKRKDRKERPLDLPVEQILDSMKEEDRPLLLREILRHLGLEKEHVEISTDSGLHVCNFIYYLIGTEIQKTKTKMIFVHIPLDGTFSWKYQIFDKIINVLLKDMEETDILPNSEKIVSSVIRKK